MRDGCVPDRLVQRGWATRTLERLREPRAMGCIQDYVELTKPRLTMLVALTTAVGFWLGVRSADHIMGLIPVLLGTVMVAGGANALNQWYERVPDGFMRRTQNRPLPRRRLTPTSAYRFGFALCASGFWILATMVNGLSALVALVSAGTYIMWYTPLKPRTPLCTLVGAIPGALPPLIGWVGARNTFDPQGWVLVAILFIWQLPHFLAIAMLYKEDYARAGFRMLPVVDPDGGATARQSVLYGATLVPISLVPTLCGMAGTGYFLGALLFGGMFLMLIIQTTRVRSLVAYRQLFLASVVYLPLLLGILAIDKRWV